MVYLYIFIALVVLGAIGSARNAYMAVRLLDKKYKDEFKSK